MSIGELCRNALSIEMVFRDLDPDGAGRVRAACSAHGAVVCGACCVDFAPFNALRYDPHVLRIAAAEQMRPLVDAHLPSYFARPARITNPSGSPMSPLMSALADRVMGGAGGEGARVSDYVALSGMMTFAARGMPAMQGRIAELMGTALFHDPGAQNARVAAASDDVAATLKKEKKENKKKNKKSGGGKKERGSAQEESFLEAHADVNAMAGLLAKAGAGETGSFFSDFSRAQEGMEAATRPGSLAMMAQALDPSAAGADGRVSVSEPMRRLMLAQQQWMSMLFRHVKDGVPMGTDLDEWPTEKLVSFLREHDVTPRPCPPRAVLVEVARKMISFGQWCMYTVDRMPDDEDGSQEAQLAAVRESAGVASDADRAVLAQERAKNTSGGKIELFVDAQFKGPLALEGLPRWDRTVACAPVFGMVRGAYAMRFGTATQQQGGVQTSALGTDTYDELLQTLQVLAGTFDTMAADSGGTDLLGCIQANEGTPDEQGMMIRVIGGWRTGEFFGSPLPLLAVTYMHTRKREATHKMAGLVSGGIKQGRTQFKPIKACTEEVESLALMLRRNCDELAAGDRAVAELQSEVPKGWRFSVFRPADPSKRGGPQLCPACGKIASKMCSKCRVIAYCSVECQKSCWKAHKKVCGKLKEDSAAAAATQTLVVGAAVKLVGLKSKPELNGTRGTITATRDAASGRFAVRCALDGVVRALKPTNLAALGGETDDVLKTELCYDVD